MANVLLCETVTGRTMAELIAARETATAGDTKEGRSGLPVDILELRLDGVADPDVARALDGRQRPVIVTCRPVWEGGRFDGSEADRAAMLERAHQLGAEFVDIEWRALSGAEGHVYQRVIDRDGARVVLSTHDFEGVPADLAARVADMRRRGAGVVKVAVTPSRLSDTLALADLARPGRTVVIGMGDAGVPSRLLAARFGSIWSYGGNAVAPGQIPAARMLSEFRFRSIGPRTRVFGVVSINAAHSLSPVMHNAAFAAAGLDAVYVPLRAADFTDFLSFAAGIGIDGASVTIPFKLDAIRAAHMVDEITRRVGAANTLRRTKDGWEATNTDVAGFLEPLEAAYPKTLAGARAAVVGAGGSARAAIVALLSRGVRVSVHARRKEQGRLLADALGIDAGAWPPPAGAWDILVNCTPLGGAGLRDESPVSKTSLTGGLVYDLTYGDGDSRLVSDAKAAGCVTLDGLPMLIAQAERQFEWWTGRPPATGVMRDAVYTRLGRPRDAVEAHR